MVNIKIKYFMEKEFINGVMDPYIKDNFIKVKCKDLAFGNQKKIKLIKVSILWIKSTVKEFINGVMEIFTKDLSKKVKRWIWMIIQALALSYKIVER